MNYRTLFIVLLSGLLITQTAEAQIPKQSRQQLVKLEDTLREYSRYLVTDTLTEDRMISDSIFTRTLVRALRVQHSFYYPFDSVLGIAKVYAPDSSFRIFTWNVQYDDYYSRQKGTIQMRTADGSLKMYPLRDVSEFTERPQDSVRDRMHWIGAVYYNIIRTTHAGKNYYTLFGFDPHGAMSSKKWIDVLSFDAKKEPVFGATIFSYEEDSIKRPAQRRISLEYKKDARVLMNYIPDLNMILTDHLISETDQPDLPWTFVPDGDNEGYEWKNGKWVHIDKAFDVQVDMRGVDPYLGKPPVEAPILDSKGKKNERKLQEQSDKNKAKERPIDNQ